MKLWDEMQKNLIEWVLGELKHNRTHTAKFLGISLRTLRSKINRFGIESIPETSFHDGKTHPFNGSKQRCRDCQREYYVRWRDKKNAKKGHSDFNIDPDFI